MTDAFPSSQMVERVAEALRCAEQNNGADNESDHYRFQAHAAIEALGLTEEFGTSSQKRPTMPADVHWCWDQDDARRHIAMVQGNWDRNIAFQRFDKRPELHVVSRLVGPWKRIGDRA